MSVPTLHEARLRRLRDRISNSMALVFQHMSQGRYDAAYAEVTALRDHVQQMHAGLARVTGQQAETLYEVPLRFDDHGARDHAASVE